MTGSRNTYGTPGKLRDAVESYFEELEGHNAENGDSAKMPIIEDMFQKLGISRLDWDTFREGGKSRKNKGFTAVTAMAEERFTAAIIQAAFANPKLITLAVHLTKHKYYGGYADRNPSSAKENPTLTVRLEGASEPFD